MKASSVAPGDGIDRAAIDRVVGEARASMAEIVRDAREYRLTWQRRLASITNEALRESVLRNRR